MYRTKDGLQSFAVATSDNDFIDAADFEAMAINYAIEREMEDDSELFDDGLEDWLDNMEREAQLESIIESGDVCDTCTH